MSPQIKVCPALSEDGDTTTSAAATTATNEYIAALRRRRNASYRLPVLECGCSSDPFTCRCHDSDQMSESSVDGYAAAAQHLLNQGLLPAPNVPALRVMWGRRGADQRLARTVAEHWEMVA